MLLAGVALSGRLSGPRVRDGITATVRRYAGGEKYAAAVGTE